MSLWGDWTEHWKSQLKRHEKEYELAALAVGTLVMGPAVTGAYTGVMSANETQKAIDATRAATKELAQTPLAVTSSVSQSLGATGEIQFSRNIAQWIPIGLIFIIIMYVIFKD